MDAVQQRKEKDHIFPPGRSLSLGQPLVTGAVPLGGAGTQAQVWALDVPPVHPSLPEGCAGAPCGNTVKPLLMVVWETGF